MGKKLNSLLRKKTFKSSKFKARLYLAISRLAILKFQCQARLTHVCSDIAKLLEVGQIQRALVRVEQVIKEENLFDFLVMIVGYCNLLIERVRLIKIERECPEELEEAISSIIYGASRCGEFPELQKICRKLTSKYGKEFAVGAIELHNDCGVSPEMIQKLATKSPSLENRLKVLHEVASENNIILPLEGASSVSKMIQHLSMRFPGLENKVKVLKGTTSNKNIEFQDRFSLEDQNRHRRSLSAKVDGFKLGDGVKFSEDMEQDDAPSDFMGERMKYSDVAAAAQAAFQSAAVAAEAARAAMEFSRTGPSAPDDLDSPGIRIGKTYQRGINSMSNSWSENEELYNGITPEALKQRKRLRELRKSTSSMSLDSDMYLDEKKLSRLLQKDVHFNDIDDEDIYEETNVLTSKVDITLKRTLPECAGKSKKTNVVRFEDFSSSDSSSPSELTSTPKVKQGARLPGENALTNSEAQLSGHIDMERKPISVRSRKHWGH